MQFNPLSPSIHIQILQTDLHTFPERMSWENLIKDQGIFFLGDHFINSHNLSVDSVWILLVENLSWSLLALKGLAELTTRSASDILLMLHEGSHMVLEFCVLQYVQLC